MNHFPVDLDLILRSYEDVMSFVVGFPYTFRPLVHMCFLSFLNMHGILLDVGCYGFCCWR